jgi:hypothetical protein
MSPRAHRPGHLRRLPHLPRRLSFGWMRARDGHPHRERARRPGPRRPGSDSRAQDKKRPGVAGGDLRLMTPSPLLCPCRSARTPCARNVRQFVLRTEQPISQPTCRLDWTRLLGNYDDEDLWKPTQTRSSTGSGTSPHGAPVPPGIRPGPSCPGKSAAPAQVARAQEDPAAQNARATISALR